MLDSLIKLQRDLIDALDRGDVDDIEAITKEIEKLISERTGESTSEPTNLSFAIKLNIAAGMRVNALANWNDQKLTRIQGLRQQSVLGRSTGYN